jgi:hypothetical protein
MTSELIIISVLLIYIGFLHYQLHKKNQFLEKLLKKQIGEDSILSSETIETIVHKIKEAQKEAQPNQNKIFEDNIQNFILKDEDKQVLYVHYTKNKEVAEKICNEGFIFAESFHKTAELVTNDKLDFVYKHYLRRQFGKYVVVLAIGKEIFNHYINEIKQSNKILNIEQVISTKLHESDDNTEDVYKLPNAFIKGYVNSETGEIFENSNFNPQYNSPDFMKNILAL